MNFLRGSFGGGGSAADEGPPKGEQDSNVRDHATFFSWKNIWTDNQEEKAEGPKSRAGSDPSAPRKGRRSSRSSTGLSVIDETIGNGDHSSSRRDSRDFLGRIGNGELCDDNREDSDTLEADDDRTSISSSETLRRGSLTDGIKRVVSKTHATPSDGKSDGSNQSGYFNIPWKDKGMSFPWKKEDAGEQGSGKSSQAPKEGSTPKSFGIGGLSTKGEDESKKNKSRSPSRHFPWASSDAGDSDSTSELSFTMPWKSSSDASKKGTGSQDSAAIHFPWWTGINLEDKKERDPSVTSTGESSEDIDSGIIGDESASLISESKPEKTKQKEKENTNPFQNVPWFIGGSSSEKKAEKNKETHSALSGFPWSREGTDKKNGAEGDTWSASVNIPWLRKSGEKKKVEKGKADGEKEEPHKESDRSEGAKAEAHDGELGQSEETDEEDIKRPSVVRRVRKVIDAKTDIKIDSMKPLIKSRGSVDSESREKIVESDEDVKGSSGQSPALYLEQLVVLKTRAGRVKEKVSFLHC
ncbi:uncharacterized protein LOC135203749 [Macrobrachium nipponense]|uniref:uncharacterized protein LOC135203749 n=1 Tax=Macrobrachium nipponense TaxID=159736 RepID=UPI0030C86651